MMLAVIATTVARRHKQNGAPLRPRLVHLTIVPGVQYHAGRITNVGGGLCAHGRSNNGRKLKTASSTEEKINEEELGKKLIWDTPSCRQFLAKTSPRAQIASGLAQTPPRRPRIDFHRVSESDLPLGFVWAPIQPPLEAFLDQV